VLYKSQFWILTILAIVAAVFSIANMVLYQSNRSTQIDVSGRQQYIQQSIQLQVLYTEMVRALADIAVRTRDGDLAALLKSQGISLPGNSPAPAPATPPAPADPTEGTK
jgi:hypothetical protein